ncbi:MAG: nickel-responsive transcriptional regulator NikR [Candidatus Omnitrophota bacterium]
MVKVTRFGVSLEASLLEKFDHLNEQKGYKNRSEAIRDLIREKLVSEEWRSSDQETVGVFSLVYNHHHRELNKILTDIQHHYLDTIVSSTHVHVDHHNCLEVIILRGTVEKIKKIANELSSTTGVKHGKLTMSSTGSNLD